MKEHPVPRSRLVILLVLCLAGAAAGCAAGPHRSSPAGGLAAAWSWNTTDHANAGMPAADEHGTATVLDHEAVVLLDEGGRRIWQVEPGPRLYDAAPLMDGDQIVVATDAGLAALDRATGTTRWLTDLGDRGSTAVAVGDRLVSTTWSRRLAAVDRASGAAAWALDLPGQVYDPPAGGGGLAIASWDDGAAAGVVAVDVATGELRWAAAVPGGGVSGAGVVGDSVIVVAGDAAAHALDLASGAPRWRAPLPGPGAPEVPPAAVGAGAVAVADRDGDLAVLDSASGEMTWSVTGVGAAERGGPLALRGDVVALPVDDGRFVVARAGRVVALVDPPGRVMGLARTAPDQLVLATRESVDNMVGAWVWRP
jgi:outer membrane protein assembly factor BamB